VTTLSCNSEQAELAFLAGGGEMGDRIRAFDWNKTPLGAPAQWSPALRTLLPVMLANRFPHILWWGPHYIQFYNDAYIPIPGKKHPDIALGRPGRECWQEIWGVIGPLIDRPFQGGAATWDEDIYLEVNRHGFIEETHFTIAYSPVPDESAPTGIGGVLATVHEITSKVIGERRVVTLRDLAAKLNNAATTEDVYKLAAETLTAHDKDITFAKFYRRDADSGQNYLAAATANAQSGDEWEVSDQIEIVDGTAVMPISKSAFLVAGLNPRLRVDQFFRDFLDLLRTQVEKAITKAEAYQEERERAAALAELDRAKTAFFSNVSHEFRTPLTLMLSPLEDSLADEQLLPARRESLEMAHRNAMRLLKLVNTLLDFSRIEAGRADVVYEPLELSEYTSELASVFRAAVEKAGIRLVVNCPPLGESIFVDREMWEKIVLNLVSNAFKFTLDGEIGVTLTDAGATVQLKVSDTGIGIPPAELPKIFDRFHRVKETRGRSHEGTGIGLALVNELVKQHGGTVTVESVPEQGSTFIVSIPKGTGHLPQDKIQIRHSLVSTSVGATPYVEEALRWLPDAGEVRGSISGEGISLIESALPDSHSRTAISANPQAVPAPLILIADDNADMREYLRRLLGTNFDVQSVADGQAALEYTKQQLPDLVLTDVMMPRLDGFGLLQALRADPRTRALPVIMLSARAGEEARVDGFDAGADDYLIKPFSARELLARVESHLKLAQVRHQNEDRARAVNEELTQRVLELQEARQKALKLAQEAEQANRLKDEFLATISHELRTPLNAILGWTQLLGGGKLDDESNARAIETIDRNARSQAQLIEDLLDVSRITSGKLRLDIQTIDPTLFIEAGIQSVSAAAAAKQVLIERDFPANLSSLPADGARLQQVVWNLLANAIKFTPAGGRIRIELRQTAAHLHIIVADSGQGIRPEFLPFVFDRFRQADGSATRMQGGLGLGLAIVRHLVEMHGGEVSAHSEGEGKGATFSVMLPRGAVYYSAIEETDTRPENLLVIPVATDVRLDGVKLLIVDDEPDTCELLKMILSTRGADVVIAHSAESALAKLTESKFDLMISDIGMPEVDGYELMRKIRDVPDSRHMPAIALTAYARSEDRLRALQSGYHTHVPKPVEAAELFGVIESILKLATATKSSLTATQ
jgi:signal transduction histidine kinase